MDYKKFADNLRSQAGSYAFFYGAPRGGLEKAADVIEELAAKLEPPNEPLTLEELREMDGEPVWVQHLKKPELSTWAIYYYYQSINAGAVYSFKFDAGDRDYDDTNCEKVWLAYRRRPEKEGGV